MLFSLIINNYSESVLPLIAPFYLIHITLYFLTNMRNIPFPSDYTENASVSTYNCSVAVKVAVSLFNVFNIYIEELIRELISEHRGRSKSGR